MQTDRVEAGDRRTADKAKTLLPGARIPAAIGSAVGALGESPYNTYHNGFGTFDVQNAGGSVVGSVTVRDILPLVARFG